MDVSPERLEDLRPDVLDGANAIVRAMVSAVPVVGSPILEVMGLTVQTSLQERRDEWLQRLADDLEALQARVDGLKLECVFRDESFVSAVAEALPIAIRASAEYKREHVRNGVLNVALSRAPEEDLTEYFLRRINDLTPLHLKVLDFYADKVAVLETLGLRSEIRESYLDMCLETAYPYLERRSDIVKVVLDDLVSNRLVLGANTMDSHHTANGYVTTSATPLGLLLVEFMRRPVELADSSSLGPVEQAHRAERQTSD